MRHARYAALEQIYRESASLPDPKKISLVLNSLLFLKRNLSAAPSLFDIKSKAFAIG
jgi:hypothetical protein